MTTKRKSGPERTLLRPIRRHGAFVVAAVFGGAAFLASLILAPERAVGIGADTLFAVYLAIVAIELRTMTPAFLKQHANEEDVPVAVILAVTLSVVAVSVFALFSALNGGERPDMLQVTIGVLSVVLGWFVVHTMAALHYAYEYYESPSASPGSGTRKAGDIVGGLEWPKGGDEPNGVAFLYLAYQVGSAVQISDVPATSNKMRGLIVVHAVFSFFYNTVLVAAAVNVVIIAAGGGS